MFCKSKLRLESSLRMQRYLGRGLGVVKHFISKITALDDVIFDS